MGYTRAFLEEDEVEIHLHRAVRCLKISSDARSKCFGKWANAFSYYQAKYKPLNTDDGRANYRWYFAQFTQIFLLYRLKHWLTKIFLFRLALSFHLKIVKGIIYFIFFLISNCFDLKYCICFLFWTWQA